jgi:hypothetical protein
LSESAHIALNIALAVAVLLIVRTVESPVPAMALVLLSKWRVFAVRPRYWAANIQANFVDVVVSIGAVMLLYSVVALEYALPLQVIIAAAYACWLTVLKPRSSKRAIVAQSATALLVGTTVLFVSSYNWPLEILVVSMAIVGYVTARHVLTQFEEDHLQFLSLLWAFVLAQLAWVLSHWTIAYSLPGVDVRIPQATLIIGAFAFVAYRVYASYRKHGQVRSVDVALPVLFSASITLVILVFFSAIPTGAL